MPGGCTRKEDAHTRGTHMHTHTGGGGDAHTHGGCSCQCGEGGKELLLLIPIRNTRQKFLCVPRNPQGWQRHQLDGGHRGAACVGVPGGRGSSCQPVPPAETLAVGHSKWTSPVLGWWWDRRALGCGDPLAAAWGRWAARETRSGGGVRLGASPRGCTGWGVLQHLGPNWAGGLVWLWVGGQGQQHGLLQQCRGTPGSCVHRGAGGTGTLPSPMQTQPSR